MRSIVAVGLVVAGCQREASTDGDTDVVDSEPTCAAPGASAVVAAGLGNTEGVTIAPDGTAYVVHRTEGLKKVAPDGTVTDLADFSGGIGATWWHGAVWVGAPGDGGEGALYEVSPAGDVTRHVVDAPPAPNFLTPTPWGTLLIADDNVDVVREWVAGEPTTTEFAPVPSPNGMAFSPDATTLWVAGTFRQPGLWSLPIADGAAGPPQQVVTYAGGTPDGVAVATDGAVLVALNVQGKLAVWQDGASTDLVPDPAVITPASLAFGRGPWDACAVLTTELFGQDVVTIQTGHEGFFPPWADAAE